MLDEYHGYGVFTGADYSKYIGIWDKGRLLSGEIIYASETTYKGDLKDLSEHGKGVMKYTDGSYYDGLWVHGKKQGPGVFTLKDKTTVEGDWKDDQLLNGTIKYSSGDIYTGQLRGLLPDGNGEMTYPSEMVFVGKWRNGEKVKANRFFTEDTALPTYRDSPTSVLGLELCVVTDSKARGGLFRILGKVQEVLRSQGEGKRTPTRWGGVTFFDKNAEFLDHT